MKATHAAAILLGFVIAAMVILIATTLATN